jgi:DNA-binding winged helix-turn-helix (wHTH) protein
VRLRFDSFTLETHTRLLTREGADVHLSPKSFDLLAILLERRPAVVGKAELRQRLWPGVHVVEANLTNLIAEIRAALERPAGPTLVRTVHGVGYAFSGEAVDAEGERIAASPQPSRCWLVGKDRSIVLALGENVVGRDAASAVWIDDESVSRRHARITVPADEARSATIEDLNSTNGTYLGGRRLTQPEPLADGDRITIGNVTLLLRTSRGGDVPTKRVRPRKR